MKNRDRFFEPTFLDSELTASFLSTAISSIKNEGRVTGITIPSFWVKKAVMDLGDSECMVCTVVGYPHGFQQSAVKVAEAKEAIAQGALGIHMVWSQTSYRSGMTWPKIEVAQLAKICHDAGCLLSVMVDDKWIRSSAELIEIGRMIQDGGADYLILGVDGACKLDLEQVKDLRKNLSSQVGIMAFWDGKNEQQAQDLMEFGVDRILYPYS